MTDPTNETRSKPTGSTSGRSSSTPPEPPPPPSPPPAPPQPAAANGSTQQATAAVSSAVGEVRRRLIGGEQIVLVASAIIVAIVYFIFEFLLDYRVVSHFTVLLAVLALVAIWIHRWGHYDFGSGYRILVGALGLAIAVFAVLSLLAWIRVGGDSIDFLHLIARIIYWVTGIAAGYGAWLVFRSREA